MELLDWNDITDDFVDGLIIGNGASIALDERFSYSSILEYALQNDLLSADVQSIYKHLHTSDFELVLRIVWHASHLNEALEIADSKTVDAYYGIRSALIETVRAVHPEHSEVVDRLPNSYAFFEKFETICSLNYDINLYWMMMSSNERENPHSFKDCFNGANFDDDWEKYRTPIRREDKCTLVFYPHGNLILARDKLESERKLASSRASSGLLGSILQSWDAGSYIPLFVSEGTTEQKLKSISSSYYLGTVYREVLPRVGKTVATFGWGFGDEDLHILERLAVGRIEKVAVAILDDADAQAKINRIRQLVKDNIGRHVETVFYDARSVALWEMN